MREWKFKAECAASTKALRYKGVSSKTERRLVCLESRIKIVAYETLLQGHDGGDKEDFSTYFGEDMAL